MSKQLLDRLQMQHLQELGMKMDYNTMLSWIIDERGKDKPLLCISSEAVDYVDFSHYCLPAYTLQDVLDALPKMIYPFPVHKIGFELWIGSGKIFYANMFNLEDVLKVRYDKELIDAAYELLVWAIEQDYVETNKNECI